MKQGERIELSSEQISINEFNNVFTGVIKVIYIISNKTLLQLYLLIYTFQYRQDTMLVKKRTTWNLNDKQ